MKKSFKTMLLIALSLMLTFQTVSADVSQNTPLDIRERLGKADLNIIDSVNVVFSENGTNVKNLPLMLQPTLILRFQLKMKMHT